MDAPTPQQRRVSHELSTNSNSSNSSSTVLHEMTLPDPNNNARAHDNALQTAQTKWAPKSVFQQDNQKPNIDYLFNPVDKTILMDHKGLPVTVDRMLATKPLKGELSTRPGPGNRKLLYLSGDSVTRTLNDIFGFDGWNLDIRRVEQVHCAQDSSKRWTVAYQAAVRITLTNSQSYREDYGAGDAVDKSLATACGHAAKASITDALKRAARHFGDKLGNSLYESQFSMNAAPANLQQALDWADNARAKTKFGKVTLGGGGGAVVSGTNNTNAPPPGGAIVANQGSRAPMATSTNRPHVQTPAVSNRPTTTVAPPYRPNVAPPAVNNNNKIAPGMVTPHHGALTAPMPTAPTPGPTTTAPAVSAHAPHFNPPRTTASNLQYSFPTQQAPASAAVSHQQQQQQRPTTSAGRPSNNNSNKRPMPQQQQYQQQQGTAAMPVAKKQNVNPYCQ